MFVWKAHCPHPTPKNFLDVVYLLLPVHSPSLLCLISMSEFAVAVYKMIPDRGRIPDVASRHICRHLPLHHE